MANDLSHQEPARPLVPPVAAHGPGQVNGTAAPVRRAPAPSALPPPENRPKKKGGLGFIFWLILLLALAAAGWAVYHFYFQPKPEESAAGQATTGAAGHHRRGGAGDIIRVVPATATTGDIGVYLTGIAFVTPYNTVTLQARVSGQLMEVDYTDGQTVKAGAKLVQIDDRPFKAQLEQFKAQKEHDQALLENANVDLKRYQVLYAQNSVQQQTLDYPSVAGETGPGHGRQRPGAD